MLRAGHTRDRCADGFAMQPLEFPGGNIGSLAVHGTVNYLAKFDIRTALFRTAPVHETHSVRTLANSWGRSARRLPVKTLSNTSNSASRAASIIANRPAQL